MPGNSVGQIALELTLNKQGFERDMSGVLGTAKTAGNSLAKIFQASSRAASNSVTKAIGGVTNQLSGMARKAAGLVAAAFSVREIVNFSKACIDLGSDLAEVQNVVDVTFGSSAKTINEFAKNAASSFGLSELSAKKYSSTIGAMFKSMGIGGAQVTEMSQKIAELSGDMASFYNLDTDKAFDKIRSGIAGVTMPLQQLGISLSQANLEAYAMANGFGTAYSKMSQAEQALVRYNYLLSVTSDAQGDFARTSQSWANQIRILQLRFEQLRATIGQGLINALVPVVQAINLILVKLQRLAEAFRNFTAHIFGNGGGSGSGSISNAASSIAASLGNASTGAAGLADGMEDTAAAAKSALKYLAPFDELNVLNTNPVSGSGGGGGALGGLADLLDDAGTTFSDSFTEAADILNPSAFTDAVKKAIERGDWYGVGSLFAEKMNEAVRKWDAYGDGFKLGEKIKNALKAFNGFLETFSFYELGDKVAQWFIGLWNGITAEEVIQYFKNALQAIQDFVSGFIGRMIKEWQARTGRSFDEFGKWLAEKLNAWIAKWQSYEDGFKLGEKIRKVLKQLNDFLETFEFVSLGEKIGDWIAGMIDGITPEMMGETIANAINGAIGLGLGLSDKLKEKQVPEKIGKAIGIAFAGINWNDAAKVLGNIITGLAKMLNSALGSFISEGGPQKLESGLATIGTAIGEAFADLPWDKMTEVINSIASGLFKMFKNAIEAFTKGGGWSKLCEGLKGLSLEAWGLLALPIALKLADGAIPSLISAIMAGVAKNYKFLALVGGALIVYLTFENASKKAIEVFGEKYWENPHVGGVHVDNADGSGYQVMPEQAAAYRNSTGTREYAAALQRDLDYTVAEAMGFREPFLTKRQKQAIEDLADSAEGINDNLKDNLDKAGFKWGSTIFTKDGLYSNTSGTTDGPTIKGSFNNDAFRDAMYKPLKEDELRVLTLLQNSEVPAKAAEMATKAGTRMKEAITATDIPSQFDEEATVSIQRFGEKDFGESGRKAARAIAASVDGSIVAAKFGEAATASVNTFGRGDFTGAGRKAIAAVKSGLNTEDLPGQLGAVAVNMINRFKSANWPQAGAAAGQAMGAHFKSNLAAAANSAVVTTGAGRPETFARIAVMANGGFTQGGLFLAGEVPGQVEMLGSINGKTGVASGSEITGIGDAVREASDEETRLLRQLINVGHALLAKDPFGTPNSAAGRWIAHSTEAYRQVSG